MTMVTETKHKFEEVDNYEMILNRGRTGRWNNEVRELLDQIKVIQKGKSLKRMFTEKAEQRGFAFALKSRLKRMGVVDQYIILSPKNAIDNLFAVYFGRRDDIEE